MITISLAGLAYMFMSTTMSDVTASASSTVDTTTSSMLTSYKIESMDIAKVYVRNTGQNPLTSLSVYVNDEPATYNITPSSIAAGQVGTITIYSFIPDGATVKITSPSGFSASKVATPCSKAIGCWKFDEGNGMVAYDSSPYGNTGTLVNGPTWTSGMYGGAIRLDGNNDYVNMGYNSFNFSNELTISLWINPGSVQKAYADIISKHAASMGYVIEQNNANTNQFAFGWYNGTTWTGSAIQVNLTANVWQHLVVMKNGATITFYLNGLLNATGFGVGSSITNSNTHLIIGEFSNLGYDRYFNGTIDEVRIYNRAIY